MMTVAIVSQKLLMDFLKPELKFCESFISIKHSTGHVPVKMGV